MKKYTSLRPCLLLKNANLFPSCLTATANKNLEDVCVVLDGHCGRQTANE